MKAWMYLNCSCQCVGRCSLYLLASLYPFLAALQCIRPKGFLTRHAATGRHIVKEVRGWGGGGWGGVGVRGGGGCFTLCWHPPRCVKAPCVSPAISLPGMGLSQSARVRGQEAGSGKCVSTCCSVFVRTSQSFTPEREDVMMVLTSFKVEMTDAFSPDEKLNLQNK